MHEVSAAEHFLGEHLRELSQRMDAGFGRVHERIDELSKGVTAIGAKCSACEKLVHGNGKPGAGERLVTLEGSRRRSIWWLAGLSMLSLAMLVGIAVVAIYEARLFHLISQQ